MHLNQWLVEQNKTKAQFSRETGISEATMSRLCAGIVLPTKEKAKIIYLKTGGVVTPNDFYIEHFDDFTPDQAA